MNGKNHLKYMLLGGAVLFVGLLAGGASPQSALLLAVVLACPLMMVFMMGGGHAGHGEGPTDAGRQNERDSGAGLGGHRH